MEHARTLRTEAIEHRSHEMLEIVGGFTDNTMTNDCLFDRFVKTLR